jgi:hypothetical protein
MLCTRGLIHVVVVAGKKETGVVGKDYENPPKEAFVN